jgi:hypothetical protein
MCIMANLNGVLHKSPNPHQYVCLHVYPPIVARQLLGKNVTATTNTHATIEELLDASFYMRSLSYQSRRLVLPRTSFFYSELLVSPANSQAEGSPL